MMQYLIFDWGDTLMRDIPGASGPMVEWPKVEMIDGAAEVLASLSEKHSCFVATNAGDSSSKMVMQALDRVGIGQWITDVFTSHELGYKKPNSNFFLNLYRMLNAEPSECCFIGNDLKKDILPAQSIGINTIWLNSDNANSHTYPGPSVKSLKEIPAIIG